MEDLLDRTACLAARMLIFLFEQMLQVQWICFFKEEATFKEFIIKMYEMSKEWTKQE